MDFGRRNFHVGRPRSGFGFQAENFFIAEFRAWDRERLPALTAESICFVSRRSARALLRTDQLFSVIAAELISGPGWPVAGRAGET
jgi:hypothetical protein